MPADCETVQARGVNALAWCMGRRRRSGFPSGVEERLEALAEPPLPPRQRRRNPPRRIMRFPSGRRRSRTRSRKPTSAPCTDSPPLTRRSCRRRWAPPIRRAPDQGKTPRQASELIEISFHPFQAAIDTFYLASRQMQGKEVGKDDDKMASDENATERTQSQKK
jgi:hypothetical protein